MSRGLLALVCGKDPLALRGDGHCIYVRVHARAAIRAGYEPHLLCLGREARTIDTDFGVVHRMRARVPSIRQVWIHAHAPVLERGLVRLARERGGPVLLHGFGVWGAASARAAARLRAEGRDAHAVLSSYTTYRVESDSQARAALGAGAAAVARYGAQALWVRAAIERAERRAYRSAEVVWVNYESVARIVRERHGSDLRIERLPYAPESDFLPDPPAPPPPKLPERPAGAPILLCASSHDARKGVGVLVEALGLLRDRGVPVRAVLLSDGPLTSSLRARVRELALADRVLLTGRVPDPAPYFRAADLFALPSLAEQSGSLALLEALRARLPAVASAVDGIPEDVTHDHDGLLVAPGDPAALADAVARVVSDAALRARLGAEARRTFERRFGAAAFSAALGGAYGRHGLG